LIADNSIGMLPEWLQGTPFDSWMWPGVLLVVAVPMTVAAVAETARAGWASRRRRSPGAALIGWIVAQWVLFQRYLSCNR
jgi:hypothetical protein